MQADKSHLMATYISDLYRYWRNSLDKELTKSEPTLTRTQWHVLGKFLCKGYKITQQKLAEYLSMDGGQLTRVLRQMEALNLITKTMDDTDRRIRYLELKDKDNLYIKKLMECNKKINSDVCSTLNDKEQDLLLSLLEKISKNHLNK